MRTLLRNFYYFSKPWLPQALRLALRRRLARTLREQSGHAWPVRPGSEYPPQGWAGWPGGRQFALVLTHDVEGPLGLRRMDDLLRLESRLGFTSATFFIPEGGYALPAGLRQRMQADGFEVGVHDLRHDGRLFLSHRSFLDKARRINRYLKEWDALGFRAGFMLHNLEWLHALDIGYDASTFDTDPFEPQPDGMDTIFPFWKAGPEGRGYVELPYTLTQDSTLFCLLGERTAEVWKRKLDWVAARGGMVLLNTHPDYMSFDGAARPGTEFPAALYEDLLRYLQASYGGAFWHALPGEVARFVAERATAPPAAAAPARPGCLELRANRKKIWIDLDNTPHVPFFEPIIEELIARGHLVMVTARDAFQVCELARQRNLRCLQVGRHHGRNPALKLTGLFQRALQLAPVVMMEKPDLAVSHGSRSQLILCNLLRLPSVLLADYEHARHLPIMRPAWEFVPEVIPDHGLYCPPERIRKYPGIKEDVYVSKFQPDPAVLAGLGLGAEHIIVTARPPATEAHYHNPESEVLFQRFMDRACQGGPVRVVLLPRNRKQGELLRARYPYWFQDGRTVIPEHAVHGLNLLWHSDLVVSGGGTMNREAAALGVPVYSIFRGPIGAVDRALQEQGRLVLIQSPEDADHRILITRRTRHPFALHATPPALARIVDHLEEVLSQTAPGRP